MAESGWFIDDIELPIAPVSDVRNIARQFQSETLFQFFPSITKSSARSFDYTLLGFIYPEWKAVALDEIAKSADTNIVSITIPPDSQIFSSVDKYAVKKLTMSRKGPLFVMYSPNGGTPKLTKVVPFTITLTQLPAEGEVAPGIDGFTDTDETGMGLQGFNELIEAFPGILITATNNISTIAGYNIVSGETVAI